MSDTAPAFTPEQREEAVEILLCMADLLERGLYGEAVSLLKNSNDLAISAWFDVAFDETSDAEDMLEAASLVRDGWNPGDSVEGMPR
jgi:hypothetical protein